MKLLHLAALFGAALALPSDLEARQTCSSPKLRKSWAKATNTEKQSYINAVLCLATKPSRLKISTHKTLYDDFGYVHAQLSAPAQPVDKSKCSPQTPYLHQNPSFLPWHRYFVHVYEKALQECGYTSTAMYWDWVDDAPSPTKAAVFDKVLGFGTNGNDTTNNNNHPRLRDGAFTSLRPTYWNSAVEPHWLSRHWQSSDGTPGVYDLLSTGWNADAMTYVNSQTTYNSFRYELENGPHSSVHFGVGGPGGDMGPQNASPNDPLFFLHHGNVDRLWWLWQQKNPGVRMSEYNGQGINGKQVGLKDTMLMLGLAGDRKVGDVMDVKGGFLCYTY